MAFFKSSTNAKERLSVIQGQLGIPTHKLVQEVETRWNSTFQMLKRMYEQRLAVGAALGSLTTDIPALSTTDLQTVSECLEILGPFNHATVELSEEKRVSSSKVIPILRMLQHKVSSKCANMGNPTALLLGQNLLQQMKAKCSV